MRDEKDADGGQEEGVEDVVPTPKDIMDACDDGEH